MKLSTGFLVQLLGAIIQYGNLASGYVPPKGQPYVALTVGIAQAVLAYFQHKSTPPVSSVAG